MSLSDLGDCTPERAVMLMVEAYGDLEKKGDASPYFQAKTESQLVAQLLHQVQKNADHHAETKTPDDCETVLSEFSSVLKMVQSMEETAQDLRFSNRSLQQEMDSQSQRLKAVQKSSLMGWSSPKSWMQRRRKTPSS